MITQLAFPKEALAVEKKLRHLPHLSPAAAAIIPDRRADLLCFAKGIHPTIDLYPLLLVECKAVKINDQVLGQIIGYNHYVQACFICVINAHEVRVGWRNGLNSYDFISYLPSYSDLKGFLKK